MVLSSLASEEDRSAEEEEGWEVGRRREEEGSGCSRVDFRAAGFIALRSVVVVEVDGGMAARVMGAGIDEAERDEQRKAWQSPRRY